MRPRSERYRLFAALYPLQAIYEPLGYARHRRAVGRGVRGLTLEVGIGTGFSLRHYASPPAVAVDPNLRMLRAARRRARSLGIKLPLVAAVGEALPFADRTFDTVVTQSTLCSVDDPEASSQELRRVLIPRGQYRFLEHGRSLRPRYSKVQRAIAPLWRRVNGGCRLTGDPVAAIERAGFEATKLRRCNGGAVARGTFHRPEERP